MSARTAPTAPTACTPSSSSAAGSGSVTTPSAMLMQCAGIVGRSGARRRYGIPSVATAEDLVDRMFVRERPNQLWVSDISEHPTREGKVYFAVVLDAFSRRVVGWSISHNPT